MKRLLLIASLVVTAGCTKKGLPLVSVNGASYNTSETLIVGAGQSNMARMPISQLLPSRLSHYSNLKTLDIAIGNTSLSQWEKGGELYQPMIDKIRNRNLPVSYLVWYQGEWEGMNVTGADSWAERFTKFVQNVRTDLNMPNLPIVFFRINEHNMYGSAWDDVRRQQEMVSISGVKMLNSDGCDLGVDGLHYSDPGYACLADRIALEIN